MKTRTKENKRRLHSLILLTAFTAVLLIVSTYAWFTTQKHVNISNLRGKVEVAEGLEISLDAKTWVQRLDFNDATTSLTTAVGEEENGSTIIYGPYKNVSDGAGGTARTHNNIVPTEFFPVSTSGESVEAYSNAAHKNALMMLNGKYAGTQLEEVVQANSTATTEKAAGYYAFDLFVKNSSKTGTASNILQLNGDSSAWVLPADEPIVVGGNGANTTYVGNKDAGLQHTIRVAFARYGAADTSTPAKVIDATADQYTILNTTYAQDITDVCIWEPNAEQHVSYIQTNIKPYFDAAAGNTTHGYLSSLTDDYFFTHTLLGAAKEHTILNVFDWFGTNSAYMKEIPTLQTGTPTDEENPIIGTVQNMTSIKSTVAGGVITDEKDLTIPGNSVTKFRVYIYIEGQDPDCVNFASYGGGIEVNIGLTKDAEDDSTYVPEEDSNTVTPANNAVAGA